MTSDMSHTLLRAASRPSRRLVEICKLHPPPEIGSLRPESLGGHRTASVVRDVGRASACAALQSRQSLCTGRQGRAEARELTLTLCLGPNQQSIRIGICDIPLDPRKLLKLRRQNNISCADTWLKSNGIAIKGE